MERVILHSDINNCFASIEAALDPSLKGKAVAVCGSQEDRHGIVLAKSEQAKKYGVYTGQTAYQAKQICPELIVVKPHLELYLKFSKLAQELSSDYTDQVEPFGLDECWLDVTASRRLFGSGEDIAMAIKERMKKELGVTVSVGVSFNKVFAKLGSDMKKPDAITVIKREDFKKKIWHLPTRELLGVGSRTEAALKRRGIFTIGDIARVGAEQMQTYLGKNGVKLWIAASGLDSSRVLRIGESPTVRSVSSGITTVSDMQNTAEALAVFINLCEDVSRSLRRAELCARSVQIALRSNDLNWRQLQMPTEFPVQSVNGIYKYVVKLMENYDWALPLRSVSVRACDVCFRDTAVQQDMLGSLEGHEKRERADEAAYLINERFGRGTVMLADMLFKNKMPQGDRINCLPGAHSQSR